MHVLVLKTIAFYSTSGVSKQFRHSRELLDNQKFNRAYVSINWKTPFPLEIERTYTNLNSRPGFIQSIHEVDRNYNNSYINSTGIGCVLLSVRTHCSKTCLQWPLKDIQNKALKDKWKLNEGQKYCRMLPLEHFAILMTCTKRSSVLKTNF